MDKIKKKVVVLGEAGVGKSALVQTYCTGGQQVTKDYVMTLVADIASKLVEVDDETDVELFFFDLSGRELLRSVVNQLLYEAALAVFVYDSTQSKSFTALDGWMDLLKKASGNRLPPSIVVATKGDFPASRAVSQEQGQNFARKIDGKFFEVNALNYQEVEAALGSLVQNK